MKSAIFLSLVFAIAHTAYSQGMHWKNEFSADAQIIRHEDQFQSPAYIIFRKNNLPKLSDALRISYAALGAEKDNRLLLMRTEKDRIGFFHDRYGQYYKGVEVEDAYWIVHSKNGFIESMNGHFIPGIQLDVNALVSESEAIAEAMLSEQHPDMSSKPSAKLLITAVRKDYRTPDMRLAWKVDLPARDMTQARFVYIDAHNKEIICKLNKTCTINNVNAQGTTYYHGQRQIITDSIAPAHYELNESVSGAGVRTLDMYAQTDTGMALPFTDTDNYWDADSIAAGVHWGGEALYDYFFTKHSRNSYDNNGGKITLYAHYGNNFINAMYFGNGSMAFGDGDPQYTKSLSSIDVIGHEYTHGVNEYAAALTNISSYGALAESFSDIFGVCAHFYHDPLTAAYVMGSLFDLSGGTYSRSLSDPKSTQNPDTYGGQYWEDPWYGQDFGGVHINCGLQNYWFYLLCEGDTGTNDNGDFYSVDSIGMDKAAQIAYRNLTVYLGSISVFSDAREGAIQSAKDLYGDCSQEVINVTNAWYAVGVGPPYDSTLVLDFEADYTFACHAPDTVAFNNLSNGADNFFWDFGDGNNSTQYSPTHIYNSPGTYDVQLTASSCYNNNQDSLIKTAYIEVGNNVNVLPAGCIAGVDYPGTFAIGIAHVQYNDIDLLSYTTDIYTDYTCLEQPAQPTMGCADSVFVETQTLHMEDVDIWVDWNNDGILDHPQELAFSADSGQYHDGVIIPPNGAVTGAYLRMRIRAGVDTLTDPCDNLSFGEIEDYSVYVWPALQLHIVHNDVTQNCDGEATAIASGGRPGISYQWDDTNLQTTQTATGLCAGTYHVTVTDGNGCMLEDSVVITQNTQIGTHEPGNDNLAIFPNPNEGRFSLSLSPDAGNGFFNFKIINLLGETVWKYDMHVSSTAFPLFLDAGSLSSGVYFFEIRSGSRSQRIKMIIR